MVGHVRGMHAVPHTTGLTVWKVGGVVWAQSRDDETCGRGCTAVCVCVCVVWRCASVREHGCLLLLLLYVFACRHRVLCVRGVDTWQDLDHTHTNQQVRNKHGCAPLLLLRGRQNRNASSLSHHVHPFSWAGC